MRGNPHRARAAENEQKINLYLCNLPIAFFIKKDYNIITNEREVIKMFTVKDLKEILEEIPENWEIRIDSDECCLFAEEPTQPYRQVDIFED